ncbi:hypothetical protein ASF88_12640 [Leifsonia sp. Leaf336]|uniref:hypothetical protein n=1 Tax=Leifsonia sp. Leaf336 TaxID=1736341 RepID=UPI0007020718|nr:hypothetical protein [Leifsonia sp. Leaf336]KQR52384.1 hypothetical protein ASF88_12640 [Leifsonia sp. Leaf336]
MKGAYVFSSDPRVFEAFAELLLEAGGSRGNDVAQYIDAQGLGTTVFSHQGADDPDVVEPPNEYQGRRPPVPLPQLSCCLVECRWEHVFIEWMRRLAESLRAPLWILDSDGTLWDLVSAIDGAVRL